MGQAGGCCFPSLHPDISPGSLQPLWKRSTAGFSLPASCPKKCKKKVSFPQQVLTGLAETCPREIGWSVHQHTVSEELAPLPLPQQTQPPGLLLTLRVSAQLRGLTLWKLLCTLMGLPASAFQPPDPKPEGMDLVLLNLSYFNRDRPAPTLTLRTETGDLEQEWSWHLQDGLKVKRLPPLLEFRARLSSSCISTHTWNRGLCPHLHRLL